MRPSIGIDIDAIGREVVIIGHYYEYLQKFVTSIYMLRGLILSIERKAMF